MARRQSIRLFGVDGQFTKFIDRIELRVLQDLEKIEPAHNVRGAHIGWRFVPHTSSPGHSPVSLTKNEMMANVGITGGDPGNPYPNLVCVSRAQEKVAAWPSVHDKKSPVISGGEAHGVLLMCPWPRNVINHF